MNERKMAGMERLGNGGRRARTSRGAAAWTAAAAGAAALCWALLAPSGEGIADWQPANGALKATLVARDAAAGAADADRLAGGGAVVPAPAASAASPTGASAPPDGSAAAATGGTATPASPSATSSSPASPREAAESGLLDLNAASEAELDGLPGIGPSKARAIADYRKAHGGFRSVDELRQVKGIGEKLLEKIRPLVRVGAADGAS
jgi:competence protein ComEA